MKTAIIYASKHGTTEEIASLISEKLKETNDVELLSLKKNANPDVSNFEMIILGTPIYMGQASGKMKTFCKANETILRQKKTGLFVCGMEPHKEKQKQELKNAYPEVLLKNAKATKFLSGAFLFEQMNLFERMIIQQIAKTKTSVHRIDWEEVDGFIKGMIDGA
jgi:menaquinone-dependent protoporphyrinogen oxidase